jgi:hypothetical protein
LRTNHSEDMNLKRQIKPYTDEGELEVNIKLLASNETILRVRLANQGITLEEW